MIKIEDAELMLRNCLCVLPTKENEKRPTVRWQPYQKRLPSRDEIQKFFPAPRCCIVCGAVSDNLECIDFDANGVAFEPWKAKIDPDIFEQLYIEKTPRGGFHVVYRCMEPVEGNQKLLTEKKEVLIETRGEGGLFLCAPSKDYETIQNVWQNIPRFSGEQRQALLDAARKLKYNQDTDGNCILSNDLTPDKKPASVKYPCEKPETEKPCEKPETKKPDAPRNSKNPMRRECRSGVSTAEDFCERGDFRALLREFGWVQWTGGVNEHWTRPGKDEGCSATFKKIDGAEILYVFSSNAEPFAPNQGYNAFQAYALLRHFGNQKEAAADLWRQGYGAPAEVPDYSELLKASEEKKKKTVTQSGLGKRFSQCAEPEDIFAEPLAENEVTPDGRIVEVPEEIENVSEEETTDAFDEEEENEETESNEEIFFENSADKMPEELYNLPGLLGLIFNDVLQTAPRKQPEFALCAALCALSILCHQRWESPQGFRANIYCLVSGESGCGKDWGRFYLKEFFRNLELSGLIRESYQSFPAIQNDIRYEYSPKLILWDEFGKAIQTMNQYNASAYTKEIIPGLMKLYTSSASFFTPSIKADVSDKKQKINYSAIPNPFITLMGTATTSQLMGNLSIDMVSEGFLGRSFLFNSIEDSGYIPTIRKKKFVVSDSVLSTACVLIGRKQYGGKDEDEPAQEWDPEKTFEDSDDVTIPETSRSSEEIQVYVSAPSPPETQTVPMTEEAENLLNALLAKQTQKCANEECGMLWARCEEQAEKLALLYAVAENPARPVFTAQAVQWGIALAEFLTMRRIRLSQEWVSDSVFDARQKEVLRYVRNCGGTVEKRKMGQRFWRWQGKEREDIFNNLVNTRKLYLLKEKTKGRTKILFTSKKPGKTDKLTSNKCVDVSVDVS